VPSFSQVRDQSASTVMMKSSGCFTKPMNLRVRPSKARSSRRGSYPTRMALLRPPKSHVLPTTPPGGKTHPHLSQATLRLAGTRRIWSNLASRQAFCEINFLRNEKTALTEKSLHWTSHQASENGILGYVVTDTFRGRKETAPNRETCGAQIGAKTVRRRGEVRAS
jgi:hypothetical protein